MKVLVLGSGAREHALVVALRHDPAVQEVAAAPGNPGMAEFAQCLPLPDLLDGPAVARLATEWRADLVVVGPEAPLVAGVADAVREVGLVCFGPSAQAAQLEGSKSFAKTVMAEAGVPTALARVCQTAAEVDDALDVLGSPYVVKDDGLAAGKGVLVTEDREAARAFASTCLAAGGAGAGSEPTVVVEEFLDGPEVSLFCITDGATVVPLALAQDFKRLGDGDVGPNTGGMGAYSPLPWVPPSLVDDVVARIAQPTIDAMARRGAPFAGVLYIGLALSARGPRVVEFNARFGDPETQVLLPRLRSSLSSLLLAAATGTLADLPELRWTTQSAVTVVLASPGYPNDPQRGGVLSGVEAAGQVPGASVLHAGTALQDGQLVAAGGRVLSVVGLGEDLPAARTVAYQAVQHLRLEGGQFRTDIAAAAASAVAEGVQA